jgi:serine/threonine-protein kinase
MLSPDIPTMIASRYRVLRELGRGGMGVVYLVEHINTGDHLALKVLLGHAGARADVVERFKREARAPARIKSEHVVKITDADVAPELGGAPFLVMEALDGTDLEKRVAATGPFSPVELVEILVQVAAALDKAHALGIVHRDLKPENIFLHRRENGESIVKLLDFGISKMLGEGPSAMEQAALTRTGAVMGTPLYMSPEQARGNIALIGPPADIWAIALIAYKLLTGQIYWWARSLTELLLQIVNEPLIPPSARAPHLPSSFDTWFARSCERDPAARWRTVGEQIQALAAALNTTVVPAAARPLSIGPWPRMATQIAQPLAALVVTPVQMPSTGISGAPVATTHVPGTSGGPRAGIAIGAAGALALAIAAIFALRGPTAVLPVPGSAAPVGPSPVAAAPVEVEVEVEVEASAAAPLSSAASPKPAPPTARGPRPTASAVAAPAPVPSPPVPSPKTQTFAPEAP